MTYAFIVDRCSDLPVTVCCRAMRVSRSAFHAWRHCQANPTAKIADDADLAELIATIHTRASAPTAPGA